MANGVLGWINRLEDGALTAGSQLPAAPASNLLVPQAAEPWVTAFGVMASADGATLAHDAGAEVTWRAIGLFRTNLSMGATIRYRLGTSAGAGDVLDTGALSGVVAGRNQHVYVHDAELAARYLAVDIEDGGNPDGQISVGLAYAGPVLQPRINFAWETTQGRQHRTDRAESRGGQAYPRALWQRRSWAVSWGALDAAEVTGQIEDADRYGRAGANLLFVPDPTSPMRDAVFGELADPAPFSWPFREAGIRAWRATIVERL